MIRKKIFSFVILVLSIGTLTFAQSTYLKIGDIKGDATDNGHKEWIVIESVSNAIEKQVAVTGATRRRSSVNFLDVVVVKKLDKATPKLMEACAKGKVIPKVELDMVSQNGRINYKVTLENVKITGISSQSNCDPNCEVREEVSFNYSKITWEYTTERGEKVMSSYDVRSGN